MAANLELGPRRGWFEKISESTGSPDGDPDLLTALEDLNLLFRTAVAILYNCVPSSGHPGGSVSAGRIVEGLLYAGMDYDISDPHRQDADVISFAAGHKALGLYAAWALRNELIRTCLPDRLPAIGDQLRFEDLLGFRRNPTEDSPLVAKFGAKALDGHPTPATPFVKLATGASGVGLAASVGLAFAALDLYPQDPPRVHVIEGEGGLTPGRVSEAMAAASSANLHNLVLHVDWNQASIDSDRVCRDGEQPGDYVQWDPVELARFHDFNALLVEDGLDHRQVLAAQELARRRSEDNRQPTAIVYRTRKGWRYGVEGRASHGSGHPCCSEDFYRALGEYEKRYQHQFPQTCPEPTARQLQAHTWELLLELRKRIELERKVYEKLAACLAASRKRLTVRGRHPRSQAPDSALLFEEDRLAAGDPPPHLVQASGTRTTLREVLGRCLGHLNQISRGALIVSSADLAGSTSVNLATEGFPDGFYNAQINPEARLVATGGICEDAMGAFLSAAGSFGRHIGVGSSYGAFMAALQHVPARLHAIGQQARQRAFGTPPSPYVMICAHAGLKTGEDGPTHADPQSLQLLQENFPAGSSISLTPWDPNEIWPCLVAGLSARPALLAIFVTRPPETVIDRAACGLPPAAAAAKGLYTLRTADPHERPYHGTLVLQGAGVTQTFVGEVLPKIDEAGLAMNIYYVSSVELYDRLGERERQALFAEERAREAMGITGFTLPTLYRWVTSTAGRQASLHPFRQGAYPGSGRAERVFEEAGLDGASQWRAIRAYANRMKTAHGGET